MAKFTIQFVFRPGVPVRANEEVSAHDFEDHPPFVDFFAKVEDEFRTVVRYRTDDIQKITRED